MYLATWGIFIDGEGRDPVEVAKEAKSRMDAPTWKVLDLETGKSIIVDIDEERVIPPANPV